jgi:hypothetical protein
MTTSSSVGLQALPIGRLPLPSPFLGRLSYLTYDLGPGHGLLGYTAAARSEQARKMYPDPQLATALIPGEPLLDYLLRVGAIGVSSGVGDPRENSAGLLQPDDPELLRLSVIAERARAYPISQVPEWSGIAARIEGAQLFAIESEPSSYRVDAAGVFSGIADIVVNYPHCLRSGQKIIGSVTIPAHVFGHYPDKGVPEIDRFEPDLGER